MLGGLATLVDSLLSLALCAKVRCVAVVSTLASADV